MTSLLVGKLLLLEWCSENNQFSFFIPNLLLQHRSPPSKQSVMTTMTSRWQNNSSWLTNIVLFSHTNQWKPDMVFATRSYENFSLSFISLFNQKSGSPQNGRTVTKKLYLHVHVISSLISQYNYYTNQPKANPVIKQVMIVISRRFSSITLSMLIWAMPSVH